MRSRRYPSSTLRNRRFYLGGIVGGKLYVYTAIPAERTLDAALAAQAARPGRCASDVVLEEWDLVSGGVVWGLERTLRSAIDGAELGVDL